MAALATSETQEAPTAPQATLATQPFYKLINANMRNRNFTFRLGLNILEEEFSEILCQSGGLHFTNLKHVAYWAANMFDFDSLVFKVEIPEDARVFPPLDSDDNKWKADKIIISEGVGLMEFAEKNGLGWYLTRQRPHWLTHMKQTYELCFSAVNADGTVLSHVRGECERYDEICLAAVRQDGMALEYVRPADLATDYKYEEICLVAIRDKSQAINYIDADHPLADQIYSAVFERDSTAINDIKYPTFKMYLAAVRANGLALEYVEASPFIATNIENYVMRQ